MLVVVPRPRASLPVASHPLLDSQAAEEVCQDSDTLVTPEVTLTEAKRPLPASPAASRRAVSPRTPPSRPRASLLVALPDSSLPHGGNFKEIARRIAKMVVSVRAGATCGGMSEYGVGPRECAPNATGIAPDEILFRAPRCNELEGLVFNEDGK